MVTLATIATGVLTARLLDVADRGIYSSTLAVASTLSFVCVAGAAEALVLAPRRGIDSRSTHSVSWTYSVVASLLCIAPIVLYLGAIGSPSTTFVVLACLLPLLGAIGPLINYSLVSNGRFLAASVLRLSPVVVQIVAILIAIAFGLTSLNVMFSTSVIGSASAVLLGLFMDRPWQRFALKIKSDAAKEIIKIGMKTGGTQVFRALSSRMDLVLVSIILGASDAGMFSVASSLTVAGLSLIASLAPVLLSKARSDSTRLTSVASALTLLMAIAVMLIGPTMLPIIYGADYADAATLLYSLSLAMFLGNIFELLLRIMQEDKQEHASLVAVVIATIAQVLFVVLSCILLDIYWVAVGSATSYIAGIAVILGFNKRRNGDSLLVRVSPWTGFSHLLRIVSRKQAVDGVYPASGMSGVNADKTKMEGS